MDSTLRPLAPPPWLSGQMNGYKKKKYIKKVVLFLVDNPLSPPPLLVDCPLKKGLFLAASLRHNLCFFVYKITENKLDEQIRKVQRVKKNSL